MSSINNNACGDIVAELVSAVQENKVYLSEIDGAIGDGDHGINMNKGFTFAGEQLSTRSLSFSDSLNLLGSILMNEIGGSMGPLYGTFFRRMAFTCRDVEQIDAATFGSMLENAVSGIQMLSDAKPGDKTLMDTLVPALAAYKKVLDEDASFSHALDEMTQAAEKGMQSTKDMVAKIGRSSRLGERSRGVLDAGATSCNIILQTLGNSIRERIDG